MNRKTKRQPKRAIALVLLSLLLLFGSVPAGFAPIASAASPPTLKVSRGTTYLYSVSGKNPDSVTYGTSTGTASKMEVSQSQNTITVKESESNKLYEIAYVPIVTTLKVPAETSLRITISFSLSGKKNGSGSATETMELFEFGSSDKSSSLTFKTTADSSSSYTKASIRNNDSSLSTGYSTTVTFQNTSGSEKDVSYYFGLLVGVHYGSSKNHQFDSSCTITSSSVTTDSVTPTIRFLSTDARTTVIGSGDSTSTTDKSQFVPAVEWGKLSEAQQTIVKKLNPLSYDTVSESAATAKWNADRLHIEQPSDAKLDILTKAKPTTNLSRLAYTPFSVPLTVPAYTTRTFYLTFHISYTRGTDSGAGFFAELIDGDAPDAFNTDKSADATGSTKLRVYSTSGGTTNVHSGTVELSVTFSNNTNTSRTYLRHYVFFAGHRRVGVYTPQPKYTLELKNVAFSRYDDTYTVTTNANNVTVTAPTTVAGFTAVSATVAAKKGYSLPDAVTVTIEGNVLAASKYTYNKSTGAISIPKDYVKGAVGLSVSGVPNRYNITYDGLDGATLTKKPTVHTYGTATPVGNPTKTGYVFLGWVVNGSQSKYKDLTIAATLFTSDIRLVASWQAETYDTVLDGSFISASSGFGTAKASYGNAWTGEFKADDGYSLPSTITVRVGGNLLASGKYTYTRSGSVGRVTIPAASVTGAIGVTVNGDLIEIVSVDITWGNMEFTYCEGDWNASTHTYENGHWERKKSDGDCFTLKNSGNVAVSLLFSYTATSGNGAIGAVFLDENAKELSSLGLAAGATRKIYVSLTGKPPSTMDSENLGTITIKIGGK